MIDSRNDLSDLTETEIEQVAGGFVAIGSGSGNGVGNHSANGAGNGIGNHSGGNVVATNSGSTGNNVFIF